MPELTFPEQTEKNRFHFLIDGVDHTLPGLSVIPVGFYRKSRNARNTDERMFILLEEMATPDVLEAFDRLVDPQPDQLYVEWAKHQRMEGLPDFYEPSTPSTDIPPQPSTTSTTDSAAAPSTSDSATAPN